jgi:hypothetical protein
VAWGAPTPALHDQTAPPPRFFALKHGNGIFLETGTSGLPLVWSRDPELFERWAKGTTGMPLVDANMRELAATGARALCCAALCVLRWGVRHGRVHSS